MCKSTQKKTFYGLSVSPKVGHRSVSEVQGRAIPVSVGLLFAVGPLSFPRPLVGLSYPLLSDGEHPRVQLHPPELATSACTGHPRTPTAHRVGRRVWVRKPKPRCPVRRRRGRPYTFESGTRAVGPASAWGAIARGRGCTSEWSSDTGPRRRDPQHCPAPAVRRSWCSPSPRWCGDRAPRAVSAGNRVPFFGHRRPARARAFPAAGSGR